MLDYVAWDFNARYAERLPKFLQKDPELVPEIPEDLGRRIRQLPDLPEALRREIQPKGKFTYALKTRLEKPVNQELDRLGKAAETKKKELKEIRTLEAGLVELRPLVEKRANLAEMQAVGRRWKGHLEEVRNAKETATTELAELGADIKLLNKFGKLELPVLALPWQMILYLTVGFATIVAVSLLTPRVSKQKLDRFYACLRTPVESGEPETEPFTLPPGVEPPPRRVWCDFLDLEIPKISPIGFVGLAATSAAVAALIAAVYWIFSLGA